EDTTHELLIKDIAIEDEAEYSITLENGEKSSAMLFVEDAMPEFVKPLKDQTIMEGESTDMKCELSKPDITTTWQQDGHELTESDRVKIVVDGVTQQLTIKDSVLDDEAEYTCVVSHEVSTTAMLYVDEAPVDFT
ncbi:unnamed protein product, partial [Owenia fusiformis]